MAWAPSEEPRYESLLETINYSLDRLILILALSVSVGSCILHSTSGPLEGFRDYLKTRDELQDFNSSSRATSRKRNIVGGYGLTFEEVVQALGFSPSYFGFSDQTWISLPVEPPAENSGLRKKIEESGGKVDGSKMNVNLSQLQLDQLMSFYDHKRE
ncbi:hypothetical protein HYV84_05370 [Candidatus Woesearchaeota archaeon]|nr:hypothetical protein [Candidatus Woesearchaeota archaeon]